jgi:hypothetical protein
MTPFLPGDIVTRVGSDRLGRVVRIRDGRAAVIFGDPYGDRE